MNILRSQILVVLFCLPLSAVPQNTTVVRAAIDIGMGGPKLQVAQVDRLTNKIVKILHAEQYFVNFYDNLAKRSDSRLSRTTMAQALSAIKEALKKASFFGADQITAVATAPLRVAVNGDEFAEQIERETGIRVRTLDQNMEGKLAFLAALSKLEMDAENTVVWDIGGGSMQFIGAQPDGSHFVEGHPQGSGAFKDLIIEKIQRRNKHEVASPNPMSADHIIEAKGHARVLSQRVNEALKAKIRHPATRVVGAGSVFGLGIVKLLGGKALFSIEELAKAVHRLADKKDSDIGGEYAPFEGANAILVLGFMQDLNIEQMHIVNVNNADGALIYEPFWGKS